MDRSGSMDGQIKRSKNVLRAIALFLFTGFSIKIIFIMGDPSKRIFRMAWALGLGC
jgi:hypothetical protein